MARSPFAPGRWTPVWLGVKTPKVGDPSHLLCQPAELHIDDELCDGRLVLGGVQRKQGGAEERPSQEGGHVFGQEGVDRAGNEALPEDDVGGLQVAHDEQGAGTVHVVHL